MLKNVFLEWAGDAEHRFALAAVRTAKQAFRVIRVYLAEPYNKAASDMVAEIRRWEVMIEAQISGNNTRGE